jgi:hypothetical protein
MIFAAAMYLFTTHLTLDSTLFLVSVQHYARTHIAIIAIVAVGAVAVIAAVVWFVRRRQTRA